MVRLLQFHRLSHIRCCERTAKGITELGSAFWYQFLYKAKGEIQSITAAALGRPYRIFFSPSRLKEMLLKERSGRSELQARVEELEGRCQSLTQQLEQARSSGEQHKSALHKLEENISHGEALRARQQAEEVQMLVYFPENTSF